MTTLRENLLDRIIHVYGFEHKVTIWFAEQCEKYPQDNKDVNELLTEIAKICVQRPYHFYEDEDWKKSSFFFKENYWQSYKSML